MHPDEIIIRQEAQYFFKSKIDHSQNRKAIDDFHELKSRLYDFYSAESKAIFLDEIQELIAISLQRHRDEAHNGQPGLNCAKEEKPEKLLFYIRQELGTLPVVAHQQFKTNPDQVRNIVFVSYSHLDNEFLVDIQRHFKPFLKQIDFWDDTKIQPGQNGRKKYRKQLMRQKLQSC
jgi:hypothetical protein